VRLSRLTAAAGLLLAITLAAFAARAEVPVPKLTARVIDQTGTLTADEQRALEGKLAAFEKARGSQIAVLLIASLGGETIEDFSGRVTDQWKLGRKGLDDGVLFAIAKQERKLRIHTGRGVQGTLTDALSRRIISDIVVPRFRSGDFAGGVNAGVDAIMKAIEGEDLALPAATTSRGSGPKVGSVSSYSNFLWIAFFAVPVVAVVLRSLVGRFAGAGLTSAITGAAAWFVFGGLAVAIVVGLLAFVFTLFLGSSMARGVNRGSWGGGLPGGFGGGGGGFGGGGGGFSGGGGGFDGGGSSGSW
jgi:uncharacterized protein